MDWRHWRRRRDPPRLIVRTLGATFLTVAAVLAAIFLVLTFETRDRVRRAVADNLDAGQRIFATLERRRQQEMRVQVATLAENPTLKAAIDTYQTEMTTARDARPELLVTIQRELDKIGDPVGADVIAVTDARNITLASTGRLRALWPPSSRVTLRALEGEFDGVVRLPAGVFRVVVVPLMLVGGDPVGSLFRATALDARYASELSALSRAQIAVVHEGQVVASTLPADTWPGLATALGPATDEEGVVALAGGDHAFRRLVIIGGSTAFYALGSLEALSAEALRDAYRALAYIALLATALAGLASLWLARALTRPIDRLSQSLAVITASHELETPLPRSGSSRELDALADTFNDLMRSLAAAEADTRAAYVGAIRALAAALDARDPYTAGHSERVSALSVGIGRHMQLAEDALEVVRLGALLHDIGKIGVSDAVLRKPGPLTPDEFELIKLHPTLGARILKAVPFLAPHLPIVELHHERPDGKGYPHGLRGDEIPLPARIVHVADAFDAMTSARAYRPERGAAEAVAELWRCRGTEFDVESVDALMRALPDVGSLEGRLDGVVIRRAVSRTHPVVAFSGKTEQGIG